MSEKTPHLSANPSRRDALKSLTLGFAGMITAAIADDKKESAPSPLPEIKTKEEALIHLGKTLKPAIAEALNKLAEEKKWGYATSKESFEQDIATASKNIPALIQLEELVTKGWITKRLVNHKDTIYSEFGVDIRVKGVEHRLNGFYWYSQSFNPER